MSKSKSTGGKAPDAPNVPLPDPERVQQTFEAAVAKVKERRGFYTALAVLVFLGICAGLYVMSLPPSAGSSKFDDLWQRAERVREKLVVGTSAKEPLAELEAFLGDVRGTKQEGPALWLLAIYHHREAWTDEKASFAERKPHLEKAAGFLKELEAERFDDILLAKPTWFSDQDTPPIKEVAARVRKDLGYAEQYAGTEPQPDPDPVVVLRTAEGDIHLQFFKELAPRHVENFLSLVRKGTYNGTAFHFVRHVAKGAGEPKPVGVMGGDPYSFFYPDPLKKEHILRWGNGGLGYELPQEEARFRIHHGPRVVTSMMRDKADWDNACQFMILLGDDASLDKRHTPFAKVVEGFEVVQKAAERTTASKHPPFKDDIPFTSPPTQYPAVEPLIVQKAIAYEGRRALEHSFPLADGEKSLDGLSSSPVKPLEGDDLFGGRRLRAVDETGAEVRPGLDVPYPTDVNAEKASPTGERKA